LAMDFLTAQNRGTPISAAGKRVVIIGGGDTGSDCLGTCHRQGAREVVQFELLPQPPRERSASTPWPLWPMQLRTTHAHEEGGRREWQVATTAFEGTDLLTGLQAKRLDVGDAFTGFTIACDMVLLAMGFTGAEPASLAMGDEEGVFLAGDVRRGASLIVWAIREGRDAARAVDGYLGIKPDRTM
jgi:glutamate synthase (NADPH/NADH) small chain